MSGNWQSNDFFSLNSFILLNFSFLIVLSPFLFEKIKCRSLSSSLFLKAQGKMTTQKSISIRH